MLLLGVLGVAAVGLVDFATGVEIRVFPLYFVPLSLVSWRLGKRAGVAFSFASAAAWSLANALEGLERSGPVVLFWNTGVQLLAFLVVALLLAELQARLEHERELSRTDALTGLPNGSALRERTEVEVARSRRWRRPLTVAFLDLDGFKAVNDTYGHATGDEALRTVAGALRDSVRGTDLAARVGGDEFVLLLPETDEQGARTLLEEVRTRLSEAVARRGWEFGVSIGSVTSDEPADTDSLLGRADALMYEQKRGRRENRATPP